MSQVGTFFHYTAAHDSHLGSILREGVIRTTESNVSLSVEHAGPRVVWLLDEPLRDGENHGLTHRSLGGVKMAVEIAVLLPVREVHAWRAWATESGSDAATRRTLAMTGGGWAQAARWRVIERPIPRSEWRHLRFRESGEVIDVPAPSLFGVRGGWARRAG